MLSLELTFKQKKSHGMDIEWDFIMPLYINRIVGTYVTSPDVMGRVCCGGNGRN